MGYGVGIASGLLRGLSGLGVGMEQADQLNLQRERLAEQQRQFDQSRATDTSSIGIPGMTPNALIPYLASLAKTKEEAARKAAMGQDIASQLRAMGTTTSMAPGASVEMPKPGGLMTPPAPGPMPAMTQQTVDTKMAALAKLLPGLLQTHPETAGAMLKDVFIPPKPISLGENATLVDPRTGQPIGPQRTPAQVPPGMEPKSFKQGGVTYERPGGGSEGKTLAERVAIARQAVAANPTPEAQAALARMEEALRVETGLAGARAGATSAVRTSAEANAPVSATDAASLGVPFGTTQAQAAGKTALSPAQRTKLDSQNSVLAIIDQMARDLKGSGRPSGPSERLAGTPQALYEIYGQGNPKLAALHGRIEGTLAPILRALGDVGNLSEGDIKRAKALMPVLAPVPDTEAVIQEKLNGLRNLVKEVASRQGAIPGAAPATPAPSAPPQKRLKFNPATGLLE